MATWYRRPGNRAALRLIATLAAGGIAGAVLWGGFNVVLDATNKLDFCVLCHEMRDTVFEEYKKTVHYSNKTGVRAVCADCHVPKSGIAKLLAKAAASRELYHWIVGTIDTKEKFAAKRLSLAQDVWDEMAATDSRECRSCHTTAAMRFDLHPEAAKPMKQGLDEGQTCIDCHKGIAHTKPDMTSLSQTALQTLQARAARVDVAAKRLYPIAIKSFFLEPEAPKPAGRLLASAELNVLGNRADMVQIGIEGWQQQGVNQVIYALPGKRIFVAALEMATVARLEIRETVTDSLTGQAWRRVSLTGWVKKDNLVADRKELWDYAAQLYLATCSNCHRLPRPDQFAANQWIGTLKDMKLNSNLSDDQLRLVQNYLQMHAKDVAAPPAGR
jgi:trimethylamine-N-oxide reductase cytochrome c-type subunit TorC